VVCYGRLMRPRPVAKRIYFICQHLWYIIKPQ
jgi:hypothetical protein